VAVVVISSVEKCDRLDGSLEVKVPMAGKFPVRSAQGASNLTGRSRSEPGSLVKLHLREADCSRAIALLDRGPLEDRLGNPGISVQVFPSTAF
jgi:hypothetical protein